jgi:hypothetical protein
MMNDKYDSQSRTYYEAQTYRRILNGKTPTSPVHLAFFYQNFGYTLKALAGIFRWEPLNRLKRGEDFSLFKNHLILG